MRLEQVVVDPAVERDRPAAVFLFLAPETGGGFLLALRLLFLTLLSCALSLRSRFGAARQRLEEEYEEWKSQGEEREDDAAVAHLQQHLLEAAVQAEEDV